MVQSEKRSFGKANFGYDVKIFKIILIKSPALRFRQMFLKIRLLIKKYDETNPMGQEVVKCCSYYFCSVSYTYQLYETKILA